MRNLTIFKNEDFGDIRTTLVDNQPYFCLADVCRILDIKNVSDCKDRLKKDGVVNNDVIDSLGRRQVANFINESNLYKCIFQSRQPYAEKFQDWVTEEVLPEIRKTGSYSLVPKSYAEALRMYADEVEQRELMQKQRNRRITGLSELFNPSNKCHKRATGKSLGMAAECNRSSWRILWEHHRYSWF